MNNRYLLPVGAGRRRRVHLAVLCLALIALPAAARVVSLTIVHTTDLHGNILPTVDYEGNPDVGGFLRAASAIESIRGSETNVILIDCGDTYQGAPESFLNGGRLMIDGLNRLGYDAWILGNHEFDWGPESLRAQHDRIQVPFLAANLYFHEPARNWLPKVRPYVVVERDGLRVAIIGLVTPGIPRWSRPHLLDGALFSRSVETLERIMPEVRALEPDVVVLAVHQGFKRRGDDFANEIEAIAHAFPDIDVMLGGHSHESVEDMRLGTVLFSQAGYHGIWVGQVDLVYDTVERRVVEKRGRLHHMDNRVPAHPGLLEAWRGELERVAETLDRPVGVLAEPLDAVTDAKGRSSMQQFICRAIAHAADVDFVLHGALSEESLPAGPVSERELWKIVPYENTIGVLSLTPAEIREVLEENFSRRVFHYALGPYGFDFDLVREDGRMTVVNLRDDDGAPLHARKRYRVAFNSYVLASGGERYHAVRRAADRPESRLVMLDQDTRGLVRILIDAEAPDPVPVGQTEAPVHAE